MKISYDKTIDALNFSLQIGVVSRTLEIAPEVLLDVDKNGRLLYLEILGASEKIGKKNFNKVIVGKKSFPVPVLV
ncbi:MAG: DUF2283 domain-containing protein [Patescibacteria group bacterium]